jgi:glycosyltransferase involved in cell wall biosynthesis
MRMLGGNVGWPLILQLAASACKWPYCRTPMHAPDTNAAARLRIAHVILSHGFAGSERSTAESCAAQCVAHDVLVVIRHDHRNRSGASIRAHLDPRVTVLEIPGRWFTQRRLCRALRDWRPDVVHAHLRRATRLLARCRIDAARVSTLHLGINGPQFLDMDALVCISPWQLDTIPPGYRGRALLIRNSLVPHARQSPERIAALRAEMGAAPGEFLIGGVGRLAKSKGWDVLLRAFAAAALPDARVALLGEGRERPRLKRLAGPRVRLLGFRPDAKDYYQAFDLFVCPSRREPMGRVILEALDAGIPVVAAAADGPKEILAEYPGELVPIDDVPALAAALRRAHAARAGFQPVDVSAHHLERVSAEMIELYRDAIARRRMLRD